MKGEQTDRTLTCRLDLDERRILQNIHNLRIKKMPLVMERYRIVEKYRNDQPERERIMSGHKKE